MQLSNLDWLIASTPVKLIQNTSKVLLTELDRLPGLAPVTTILIAVLVAMSALAHLFLPFFFSSGLDDLLIVE